METPTLVALLNLTGIAALLVGYFTERGKNAALRRDVGKITEATESARHPFNVALHEQQTRFSRLHERRAEAIDGLYKLAVRTQYMMAPAVLEVDPGADEHLAKVALDEARKALHEMASYFAEHRLYYTDGMIEAFQAYDRLNRRVWVTMFSQRPGTQMNVPQYVAEQREAKWEEAAEAVRTGLPEHLRKLEDEMRALLSRSPARTFEEPS